jgi:hypothetical protein
MQSQSDGRSARVESLRLGFSNHNTDETSLSPIASASRTLNANPWSSVIQISKDEVWTSPIALAPGGTFSKWAPTLMDVHAQPRPPTEPIPLAMLELSKRARSLFASSADVTARFLTSGRLGLQDYDLVEILPRQRRRANRARKTAEELLVEALVRDVPHSVIASARWNNHRRRASSLDGGVDGSNINSRANRVTMMRGSVTTDTHDAAENKKVDETNESGKLSIDTPDSISRIAAHVRRSSMIALENTPRPISAPPSTTIPKPLSAPTPLFRRLSQSFLSAPSPAQLNEVSKETKPSVEKELDPLTVATPREVRTACSHPSLLWYLARIRWEKLPNGVKDEHQHTDTKHQGMQCVAYWFEPVPSPNGSRFPLRQLLCRAPVDSLAGIVPAGTHSIPYVPGQFLELRRIGGTWTIGDVAYADRFYLQMRVPRQPAATQTQGLNGKSVVKQTDAPIFSARGVRMQWRLENGTRTDVTGPPPVGTKGAGPDTREMEGTLAFLFPPSESRDDTTKSDMINTPSTEIQESVRSTTSTTSSTSTQLPRIGDQDIATVPHVQWQYSVARVGHFCPIPSATNTSSTSNTSNNNPTGEEVLRKLESLTAVAKKRDQTRFAAMLGFG